MRESPHVFMNNQHPKLKMIVNPFCNAFPIKNSISNINKSKL